MSVIRRRSKARVGLSLLLGLCVALWSLAPTASHVPEMVETLQDHAQMVAEHGHSHGFEEDLAWAMHGHPHDVVDHDHSPVALLRAVGRRSPSRLPDVRSPARFDAAEETALPPPERPPRA